ncbi:hypothetical protein D5086_000243 [Populus alba]|uniref:Uncharacterized protein n=1 Tax=Populus alba TaxID=43335 RepID=A0ACC4CVS9_POPAL
MQRPGVLVLLASRKWKGNHRRLHTSVKPAIWTISHGRTPFISAAGGLRCCLLSEDYGDKAVSVFETRIEGGAKSDLALLSVFRSRCSFSREIVTVQSPKEEN